MDIFCSINVHASAILAVYARRFTDLV